MKNIAITGANSGIGKQLALDFAKHSCENTTLFLAGRNVERLENVAKEVESYNAVAQISAFDVTNLASCKEWCEEIFASRLDLLIINAGISIGNDESALHHIKVAQTNTMGVANLVFFALEMMKKQDFKGRFRGHIVLVASVASLLAMPNAPSYSASKNFVRILGEALSLSNSDICITTICPGFIETPLVQHLQGKVPMMNVKVASNKIIKAIQKQKNLSIFPSYFGWLVRFYNILPFVIKRYFLWIFKYFGKL
ncbi:short-chain dehydrogenase [Helicobacter didelphidarum]|uniref:Short-chain dehydrogenase n=1 Tax=Helicobacter didelphidarum TaxID=2040648 RepID=A0A3D8IIK5_9HELI|nr:SDR family NAD(P)-dependent oxidoreductase [Helicobacter didelphidarum]RDU64968.1 short-chain dehydrogenase [Helicobacter didelphidarum]